jgi:hypothetical protein
MLFANERKERNLKRRQKKEDKTPPGGCLETAESDFLSGTRVPGGFFVFFQAPITKGEIRLVLGRRLH